jgi:osmotically-inducible protein OsmY
MPRHPPKTYREISRRVPAPDTGVQPAEPRDRSADPSITERVEDLIATLNLPIGFEVAGRCVKLRGTVPDAATAARIERAVEAIDGVEDVESYLRVG